MEERRSIQDIIPPVRSKPIRIPSGAVPPPPPPPTPPKPLNLRPEKSNLARIVYIIAGVLIVIGIAIGVLSTFFHRAYVMVTPYAYSAKVEETLQSAPQDPILPYQTVSVSDTATKSVPATGSSHVENHAVGTITVYNAYSTASQKLIPNTRFTNPQGLIYRIHDAITVPGYTMKAGIKVPGSVDVLAYADQAGESYNSALTDFTIPGLKGSPQYALMTARSKTPMAGGFIGEQAVVDPTLRQQTVDELKAGLAQSLAVKIQNARLPGSIVFPDTVSVTYTENPDSVSGNKALISVSGQAAAPSFVENSFAHELARASGISYGGPLSIDNPSALTVHTDASGTATDTPLSVSIAGTVKLVSTFDKKALAADLAGRKKSAIQAVLPNYPGISAIDVKIYPFWLGSLPKDPGKVNVKVVDSAPLPNT